MKKLLATTLCLAVMGSTSAFADSGEKISLDKEETPIVKIEKREPSIVKIEKEENTEPVEKKGKKQRRKISLKNYRTENPVQFQLLLAGNNTVVEGTSGGVGIKASYTFNKRLSISLMTVLERDHKSSSDDRDYDYDEDEVFGQDNIDDIDSEVGLNHVLELNYTPWDFGLYFSAGAYYHGKEKHEVDYKKTKREINGTEYTTGLEAEVAYDVRVIPTIGIGYNHVFGNGFTMGTGLNIGLASGQNPDVEVNTVNSDSTVAQGDLDHWKDQIEHNEKRYAGMFHFSVGYAF